MNRNRLAMGLAVAVVVALVFSLFVYRQFQAATTHAAIIPMRNIVVAAEPLPLGTRLDAAKLRTISWPATQPVAGMCTRVADCTGRALITSVAENEPILESKLAPKAAGAGLAATIPRRNARHVGSRERCGRRCRFRDARNGGGCARHRSGGRHEPGRAEHHAHDS